MLRDVEEVVYSWKQVSRIIEKFEQHGTICDRRKRNSGQPMNQSNYNETIGAVEDENDNSIIFHRSISLILSMR